MRESGGVAARSADHLAIDVYLAAVYVPGAIEELTAEGRVRGSVRGAFLAALRESLHVMWELADELRVRGPKVSYERCVVALRRQLPWALTPPRQTGASRGVAPGSDGAAAAPRCGRCLAFEPASLGPRIERKERKLGQARISNAVKIRTYALANLVAGRRDRRARHWERRRSKCIRFNRSRMHFRRRRVQGVLCKRLSTSGGDADGLAIRGEDAAAVYPDAKCPAGA